MQGGINRLQTISDRLGTRIQKMQAAGADTSEADFALVQAQSSLIKAQSAFDESKKLFNNALDSDTPREGFKTARARYSDAVGFLRETMTHLQETVSGLKTMSVPTQNIESRSTETPAE
jgi:hypothetical protein